MGKEWEKSKKLNCAKRGNAKRLEDVSKRLRKQLREKKNSILL